MYRSNGPNTGSNPKGRGKGKKIAGHEKVPEKVQFCLSFVLYESFKSFSTIKLVVFWPKLLLKTFISNFFVWKDSTKSKAALCHEKELLCISTSERKTMKNIWKSWKSNFFIMHMRGSCKAHEEKSLLVSDWEWLPKAEFFNSCERLLLGTWILDKNIRITGLRWEHISLTLSTFFM